MNLSRNAFDDYSEAVSQVANYASNMFLKMALEAIGPVDVSKMTLEQKKELRNTAIDLAIAVEEYAYDASAALGVSMVDQMTDDLGIEIEYDMGEVNTDRIKRSARYHARSIFGKNDDFEGFMGSMVTMVNGHILHAADEAVMATVDATNKSGRNKQRLYYARVPVGPTCAYCIMLASRGFVYSSRRAAGDFGGDFNRFHEGCDCKVMPGINGVTKIEGYDPNAMRERYYQCLEDINGGSRTTTSGKLYEDFLRDVPEEKRKEKDAFNKYCRDRVIEEMESRGRDWLYAGVELWEPEE